MSEHMVVCGDDVLAHRLATELNEMYGERVTLIVPPLGDGSAGQPASRAGRAMALFGRVTAAVTRTAGAAATGAATTTGNGAGSGNGNGNGVGNGTGTGAGPVAGAGSGGPGGGGMDQPRPPVRIIESAEADDAVLRDAGVERAAALALVLEDDERNIRAAMTARRLNPRLRLVIRLYNRKLGQHLATLLDQAAIFADPGLAPGRPDAATTVLSDAATAAPALAATAVVGSKKVIQAGGLLLHAVDRNPPGPGELADPGLCALALLSATSTDPAGSEGSDLSGDQAPRLLPADDEVAAATGRATLALERVDYEGPTRPGGWFRSARLPVGSLFSRRVRWSVAGVAAAVTALAVASTLTTGDNVLHAAYLILLDIFGIGDPAVDEPTSRQVLQILAGLVGLLLLPLVIAALLEAFGTFRSATTLRRPPRGLSGHVVLLGLGKIGTRVLARLCAMDIPVVCVEADPEARGIALARRLRVPTVVGDVTEEGVLEAARIHRARALLALTSVDITNLEAVLHARSINPGLRVALRLYDDDFATAVYRTLRAVHPHALTRSRSVSHLSAPSFAGAMMGRQILGAIPVERRVLLFAALDVAEHPLLQGRTVAEAFRPGAWRVIACGDAGVPSDRAGYGPLGELPDDLVLGPGDRVVVAATRRGFAELHGRRPR
jgi:Trk K+ transport system NAD-binding subunit